MSVRDRVLPWCVLAVGMAAAVTEPAGVAGRVASLVGLLAGRVVTQ
ncbi:hypothetical protein ISU07_04910 [Nocardioides islandensis]|uniref:Uncharacterized protein n=1 Tax=Nocardioides islandensis TaxID=433663 RepID=A0A930VD88_9ACTN|nr:hypothetical protein [Nocardioides islandensis]MBF4762456.1 hypothetical protein [Nocardioides islandensis]